MLRFLKDYILHGDENAYSTRGKKKKVITMNNTKKLILEVYINYCDTEN